MKEEILNKLMEYLQRSEDFLLEECPEILQQALRYHYISNIVTSVLLFLGICIFCVSFYYFYFYPKIDKYGSTDSLSALMTIFSPMVIAFLAVGLSICVDNLIKITFAPKYFLINLFLR